MTLTCSEPSNLADIAKQIHATALQAEQDIWEVEQVMRGAVNLPTVVLASTANYSGLAFAVENDLAGATWGTTFDNTAGGSGSGSGGFGPQNSGFFTKFLGEGLYEVGMCLTVTASGVVNNNSVRAFRIDHMRPDPASSTGETRIQQAGFLMFESDSGLAPEISFAGHFRARRGDRFAFIFVHGNGSSSMQVNSGAIVWASKLSETTLTRVL